MIYKCVLILTSVVLVAVAFGDEFYAFKNSDERFGFLNKDGEIVVEPKFESANYFTSQGRVLVKEDGVSYLYKVNEDQLMEVPDDFDFVFPLFFGGKTTFVQSGKHGIINSELKVVIDPIFVFIRPDPINCETIRRVSLKDRRFFIDLADGGSEIESPDEGIIFDISCQYAVTKSEHYALWKFVEDAWVFQWETLNEIFAPKDGLIRFQEMESGLFGFLGVDGAVIVPAQFNRAHDFYNNYALVEDESGLSFINARNEPVLDLDEGLSVLILSLNFINDLVVVQKGDFHGILFSDGKYLIPPFQDLIIRDFTGDADDLILVINDGLWAWVDNAGRIVWKSPGFLLRE